MVAPRLLLFDTASVYFRAFFGVPTSLRTPDGQPVNAVRGLLDYLARFITDYQPSQVVCCWDDAWRPSWRVALLPSYKAHRVAHGDVEEVPAELTAQIPLIRQVLDAAGIAVIGAPDHEADDVIATLAAASDIPTDVVTGDRDLFQLVDDARQTRVLYLGRGAGTHDVVDENWLLKRYGVTGAGYVDFSVLRGDPSDGLPGVGGIGEKTAAALLARHGDLEGVLAAVQTGQVAPRAAAALAASVDYLGAAVQVVRAATTAPVAQVDSAVPSAPREPERFAALAASLNLGGSAERFVEALAQARNT